MAYERKDYAGAAADTTLAAGINGSDTSISITASTGWPSGSNGPFVAVIDAGTASEEKVLITSRTGTTLNSVTRGYDGTSGASHETGATISHCISAKDLDEANYWVAELAGAAAAANDIIIADGNDSLSKITKGSNSTVLAVDSGGTLGYTTVTSAMIADGTIVNADVNASAAIALSKLATDPLARANHTGTQLSTTISDFTEAAQDVVGGLTGFGGSGLAFTYDDAGNAVSLAVNVDDATVEIVDDALQVKDSGIDTDQIADDSITAAKLAPELVQFRTSINPVLTDGVVTYRTSDGHLYLGVSGLTSRILAPFAEPIGGIWRRNAAQSINSATLTAISWDAEDADSDGFCTPTSSTITIPSDLAGLYAITVRVTHSWANNGNLEELQIVTGAGTYISYGDANHASALGIAMSITVPMTAGDTITVNYLQATGGAQNVTARIDLNWIAPA